MSTSIQKPASIPESVQPISYTDNTLYRYEETMWKISKLFAVVGVIIGTIVGIIVIVSGFSTYGTPENRTIQTTAKIVDAVCVSDSEGRICSVTIEYTVNSTVYKQNLKLTDRVYFKDEFITIWYDPSNPSVFRMGMSYQTSGAWSIFIGLCLIVFTWVFYWIVFRNRELGTLLGLRMFF